MTCVAVIGAGPYGLAVGAHLAHHRVPFRLFGAPMQSWIERMPDGMLLKSEGFASNIGHPRSRFTLRDYCRDARLPYGDLGRPIEIETFREYGRWFQRGVVPQAEPVSVRSVARAGPQFDVTLADGATARFDRVTVASGITECEYVPSELLGLGPERLTHSSQHRRFDRFAGRDVTVIGRGQSALESAALLHEHGARVRVLARAETVAWNPYPWIGRRPLRWRARAPRSPLGDGWRLWFFAHRTGAFARLPYPRRVRLARETLGPAGAWWLRDRVERHVPVMLGYALNEARAVDGGVRLRLQGRGQRVTVLETEHVVAATGYRVDVRALGFLGPQLRQEIACRDGMPVLSATLESSVPGLHFTGLAAAATLGPVMRFVCGSGVAAARVADGVRVAPPSTPRRGAPPDG
jgi:hypothetical protein